LEEYSNILKINLWCEFGPLIKTHSRFKIGKWYEFYLTNKHYIIEDIPKFKNKTLEFIINLGLKYATTERFKIICDKLKLEKKLLNDNNDISKLVNELDKDIEENYKNELIEIIWKKCMNTILDYSREDFEKWFSSNINLFYF
jgi:hypothetical protein